MYVNIAGIHYEVGNVLAFLAQNTNSEQLQIKIVTQKMNPSMPICFKSNFESAETCFQKIFIDCLAK